MVTMIVRMAAEGIPLLAIKRITQAETQIVSQAIDEAVREGLLVKRPLLDWEGEGRPPPLMRDFNLPEIDSTATSLRLAMKMPPSVAKFVAGLAIHGYLSKSELARMVLRSQASDSKIVDVYAHKIRKMGIELRTLWGAGYAMDDEQRATLMGLVDEHNARSAA